MIRLPSAFDLSLASFALCLAAVVLLGNALAQGSEGGGEALFQVTPPAGGAAGTPHKLELVDPGAPFGSPETGAAIVLPDGVSGAAGNSTIVGTQLTLHARLTEEGVPLPHGLTWRVFAAEAGPDGALPLVATAEGGSAALTLPPGGYFVHASFGRAGATQRIELGEAPLDETLVLDAGGLRLSAVVGEDFPLERGKVAYEIYRLVEDGQRELITPNAEAGRIVRLHAGTYHVVSRYGALNAVVRADIEVKAGELTEAVIHHKGAEVTLKLVEEEGGEALANTRWSVLTQGGDTIHESVGAFPHIILTEGAYTAVARHGDTTYARDFDVSSGVNGEVEVRLTDIVRPQGERQAQ